MVAFSPQPKQWPWIRRFNPHFHGYAYYGPAGELQTSWHHWHYFEIDPKGGGRFGQFLERFQDRPTAPFVVFNAGGKKVVSPPGLYTWYQLSNEWLTNASSVVSGSMRYRFGGFYDGDFKAIELTGAFRVGSRFNASTGWTRQIINLPYGKFNTDLVPTKLIYSFTPLYTLQAYIQYNNQISQFSSNIRLALMGRSGTGVFVVYNDTRDTTSYDPHTILGRSFIVKYSRLIDF